MAIEYEKKKLIMNRMTMF